MYFIFIQNKFAFVHFLFFSPESQSFIRRSQITWRIFGICFKALASKPCRRYFCLEKSNMKRANRKFVLFTAWDKFQLETFPASCLAPPEASDCRQHTEMKESNRNKILWYIYINMYLWQEVGLKLLYTLDLSPGLHHVWAFQPDISDGVVTSHPDTLYSWQG